MDDMMLSPALSNDTDPTKLGIGNWPNVATGRLAWSLAPPTLVLAILLLILAVSPWLTGLREAAAWAA